MALGFAFRLDDNCRLLIGVPLTVLFQEFVGRRPLRDAWVRHLARPRLDTRWAVLTAIFGAYPSLMTVRSMAAHHWVLALWFLAASIGATGAAFAIRHRRAGFFADALQCLTVAGGIGVAIDVGVALFAGTPVSPTGLLDRLLLGLRWLILYFPVSFVLEEVTFRGVLDTHVAPEARPDWRTAAFVSALWGIWHSPGIPLLETQPAVLVMLVAIHMAVGVPLSLGWRRSGNLVVPALAHALIDAVRNALN